MLMLSIGYGYDKAEISLKNSYNALIALNLIKCNMLLSSTWFLDLFKISRKYNITVLF